MNSVLFHFTGLPVAAILGVWYFYLKKNGKKSILVKCLCSLIYVLMAAFALESQGIFPPAHPVFWFLVCCVAADGLLEVRFVPGMLLFGLGHCILILWMLCLAPMGWASLLIWVVCLLAAWMLFRRHILAMGKRGIPFVVYAGFLAANAAVGISLSFTMGWLLLPLSVGTGIFYVSDLFVAKDFFRKIKFWESVFLMILYWGALFLISLTLWVI